MRKFSFVILVAFVAATAMDVGHAAQWAKSYVGLGYPASVKSAGDGGYIAAGSTLVPNAWVVKLGATGEISWQKTFEGMTGGGVHPTADGGYIVGGRMFSTDGVRSSLLLKLDAVGNIVWQRSYSNSAWDMNYTLEPTADGGSIATGSMRGIDYPTLWIMKLHANGDVAWQKTYVEMSGDAGFTSAHQTADGGYIVAGGLGSSSSWLSKLNGSGDVVWQRTYGESAPWVRPTRDGGYIAAGYTTPRWGSRGNALVLRLDVDGEVIWQKAYGGNDLDASVRSIRETSDGGFVMTGGISRGPGMSGGAWVAKLDGHGEIVWQWTYGNNNLYAIDALEAADGGYVVGGMSSFEDTWVLKLDASGAIPGCGMMRASNATAATTTTNVGHAAALLSAGNATPANSGVTERDSAVVPTTHCYSAGPGATVIEYYHAGFDHYFITWMSGEIAMLDAGTIIGWERTDYAFKTYSVARADTSPVCRFYIPPNLGDSHFFGRGTSECNATGQKNPSFVLEDPAFMQMFLPTAGVCPSNTTQVYRVFSNRPDANHRYMTDRSVRDQMVAKGWLAEGDGPDLVVMCAPQ